MATSISGKSVSSENTTGETVLDDPATKTEEETSSDHSGDDAEEGITKDDKLTKVSAPPADSKKVVKKENDGKSTESSTRNKDKKTESSTRNKDQKTESSTSDEDKPEDNTQSKPGLWNIFNSVGFLLFLAIACIIVAACLAPAEPEMKSDFDLVKIFGNGVDKLQESFTNQTDRFWRILKHRGLAHLKNKHPSQPLVFLLAAPPPAHEWVDCLATKLAEKLDPKQKRNLARIDGTKEKSYPADKTKKKMDDLLKEKFRAGHRVALIHHLELLPPPSPLLFYAYCDDQNAPHKHVAIIFTVHLPVEPSQSLSATEAEGFVEKYLSNEVWSRDDMDAKAALLSRIADTVALMNGESSNSLKAYCA